MYIVCVYNSIDYPNMETINCDPCTLSIEIGQEKKVFL